MKILRLAFFCWLLLASSAGAATNLTGRLIEQWTDVKTAVVEPESIGVFQGESVTYRVYATYAGAPLDLSATGVLLRWQAVLSTNTTAAYIDATGTLYNATGGIVQFTLVASNTVNPIANYDSYVCAYTTNSGITQTLWTLSASTLVIKKSTYAGFVTNQPIYLTTTKIWGVPITANAPAAAQTLTYNAVSNVLHWTPLGAGTITEVVSGYGLTGGGASGAVTQRVNDTISNELVRLSNYDGTLAGWIAEASNDTAWASGAVVTLQTTGAAHAVALGTLQSTAAIHEAYRVFESNRVGTLQTTGTAHAVTLGTLQTTGAAHAATLGTLQTTGAAHAVTLGTLQTTGAAHAVTLGTLQTTGAVLETYRLFESNRVTGIQGSNNTAYTQITSLQTSNNLASVATGAMMTTLGALQTSNGLASTATGAIMTTLGSLQSTGGAHAATIATLQTTSAVLEAYRIFESNRVGTLQTTASVLEAYRLFESNRVDTLQTTGGAHAVVLGTLQTTGAAHAVTLGTLQTTGAVLEAYRLYESNRVATLQTTGAAHAVTLGTLQTTGAAHAVTLAFVSNMVTNAYLIDGSRALSANLNMRTLTISNCPKFGGEAGQQFYFGAPDNVANLAFGFDDAEMLISLPMRMSSVDIQLNGSSIRTGAYYAGGYPGTNFGWIHGTNILGRDIVATNSLIARGTNVNTVLDSLQTTGTAHAVIVGTLQTTGGVLETYRLFESNRVGTLQTTGAAHAVTLATLQTTGTVLEAYRVFESNRVGTLQTTSAAHAVTLGTLQTTGAAHAVTLGTLQTTGAVLEAYRLFESNRVDTVTNQVAALSNKVWTTWTPIPLSDFRLIGGPTYVNNLFGGQYDAILIPSNVNGAAMYAAPVACTQINVRARIMVGTSQPGETNSLHVQLTSHSANEPGLWTNTIIQNLCSAHTFTNTAVGTNWFVRIFTNPCANTTPVIWYLSRRTTLYPTGTGHVWVTSAEAQYLP